MRKKNIKKAHIIKNLKKNDSKFINKYNQDDKIRFNK